MSGVPSNIILPFVGIEFDASRAAQGAGIFPMAALLIGQKTSGGSITAEVLTQVFSADEVENLCGTGSMLHLMAKAYFANNKTTDVFIIALDDAATSTAATRELTITGPATASGELAVYINGVRIAVSVAKDDTVTDIGDNLVSRLADFEYLPFTAANVAGVVTFTAKNKGVAAGDNDMRINALPTDQLPAGVGASFAATTPGTVDPDIQDAIDVIGDQWLQVWANPYADATNLEKVEDYLEVVFGPTEQKDGVSYQAMRGSVSTITTFSTGTNRNSPHCVLVDAENRQCSTWELVSEIAALVAGSALDDPGKPLHRMKLAQCPTNDISERRTLAERNTLARNGVMTLTDDIGVQTEATVTMYLKNSAGAADTAYQYQNTMFILQYMRWLFVQRITLRYARARLVDSSERIKAGIQVITPEIGRAEAIAWFRSLEADGLVENIDQFKNDIVCERDGSNVNRLNWILPPDLANQFIVGSGVLQFLL